jgi:Dolichyl-phosphate-mannose-protein mannosyltransferase
MDHGRTAPRPAEADQLAAPSADWPAGTHRAAKAGWQMPRWWPAIALPAVLAVQAVLTLRLLNADTAFQDEALYLWAGHREWAHLLHGASLPPFPAYFSGAPVLYPPVGALADSIGGLVAARALSLLFMLAATALLWATASRLFGRLAGLFASGLFAVFGPVLYLGAFATYDAMSLLGVALATWFVVRAADRRDATGWLIAAGVVLALANATAYTCTLFDPVVILIAALTALGGYGGKVAAARAGLLLAVVAVLIGAGLLIGGSRYLSGIGQTTIIRTAGSDPASLVLTHSWSWAAIIAVVAVAGVITGYLGRAGGARIGLLALLACAIAIVPAVQASLHTAASLNKHLAVGAWFAAIAAGYAASRFISQAPRGRLRVVTCTACILVLALPASIGASQSRAFATAWPNSASFIAILRPLVEHSSGRLLVEDPSLAEYYLPGAGAHWQRWSSTRNIVLPSGGSTGGPSSSAGVVGAGNAGVFAVFIQEGYFSYVALNFADTTALDHRIAADLRQNRHYRIIDVVPYFRGPVPGTYVIWRYEPSR